MAQSFNIISKKAYKPFAQYAWRAQFTGVNESLKDTIKETLLDRLNYCITKVDFPKLAIDSSKNKFEFGDYTLMLPGYNPGDMQIKMTLEETDDMLVASFIQMLAGDKPWLNPNQTHNVTFLVTLNDSYDRGEVRLMRVYNGHMLSYSSGKFNRNGGSVNAVEYEITWSVSAVDTSGIAGEKIGANALYTEISKEEIDEWKAAATPPSGSQQDGGASGSAGEGSAPAPAAASGKGNFGNKGGKFPYGKGTDTKNTSETAKEKRRKIAAEIYPGNPKKQQQFIDGTPKERSGKIVGLPLGGDGQVILNQMNCYAERHKKQYYDRNITNASTLMEDMGLIYNSGQGCCAKSVSLMQAYANNTSYKSYGNGNNYGQGDNKLKVIAQFTDGAAYHQWVAAHPNDEYIVSISYTGQSGMLDKYGHVVAHTKDNKFLSNSTVETENTYSKASKWVIMEPSKA